MNRMKICAGCDNPFLITPGMDPDLAWCERCASSRGSAPGTVRLIPHPYRGPAPVELRTRSATFRWIMFELLPILGAVISIGVIIWALMSL